MGFFGCIAALFARAVTCVRQCDLSSRKAAQVPPARKHVSDKTFVFTRNERSFRSVIHRYASPIFTTVLQTQDALVRLSAERCVAVRVKLTIYTYGSKHAA